MTEEEMARANMPLVYAIARKLKTGEDFEELIGAGNIGLLKAIRNYDESLGYTFSTYAFPVILGEMKRFLRDNGPIKVSRDLKELNIKIAKASKALANSLNRSPTVSELAKELQVNEEQIALALDSASPLLSIDDEEGALRAAGKEDSELSIDRLALRAALEVLGNEERKIILLRYYKGFTQRETADILKISQVQVSRKEKAILQKLKNHISA